MEMKLLYDDVISRMLQIVKPGRKTKRKNDNKNILKFENRISSIIFLPRRF